MPANKKLVALVALIVAGLFLIAVYFAVAGRQGSESDARDQAVEAYDRADYRLTIKLLRNKPLEKPSKKLLISAYLNSGRYGEAAQLLEEFLEGARDNTDPVTALYLLSLVARAQKDHEKAASLIQHALTLDKNPQLRRDLADIYLEAGRNDQAVIELEQLLAAAPEGIDLAGTRSKLIAAYQALGQTERAKQLQEEATGAGTTP